MVAIFMSPGWQIFFNLPSVLIVMGGTAASTLLCYPLSDMSKLLKVMKNAFTVKIDTVQETIEFWYVLSRKARKDGLLALEEDIYATNDGFTRKGIQLMVDGIKKEVINEILLMELSYIEERHIIGQKILKVMGTYAPAFGMIGTLIGLVQMLTQLTDPSKIGSGMAVALITTLYGSFLANVVFLPFATKLERRSQQELQIKQLIINAIWSIQAGDNPRLLNEKLLSILSPSLRENTTANDGALDE
ncbi:MAG TPA: motility protein A [bacterium]|nr:motility protein A [bacterium]HPN43177.1 motility protein A [bacterium]